MSDDVSVELSVSVPCGRGSCGQSKMVKTILFTAGMVPIIGDQIETEYGPHKIRLHVIGRMWWNRHLTLLCKPSRSFSVQSLIDSGFSGTKHNVQHMG